MRNLLLTILLLVTTVLFGQKKQVDHSIQLKSKIGYLMAHRPVMNALQQGHVWGFELNYKMNFKGTREWQRVYKYPSLCFGVQYYNLGYEEVLGHAIAVYPYLELPFINRDGYGLNFNIGLGYGYITKKFDQETNPMNLAVGTHSNAIIQLGASFRKTFKRTSISVGFDFTHFSNASSELPNLGLNIPNFYIGLEQTLNEPVKKLEPELKKYKGISFHAQISGFYKERYPTGGQKFPVVNISAFMNNRFNYRSAIDYGFDVMYNGANGNPAFGDKHSFWETVQFGAFAQHNFIINELRILLGMGVYIKDDLKLNGLFYNKVGLRYYLKKNWYFNVNLKTHYAKADYIEFGIGYFYKSKNA